MELAPVGVTVAIIILFTAFAVRSRGTSTDKEASREVPAAATVKPLPPVRPEQPVPFDARTAKPVRETHVVSGPVYVTDGDTITIKNTQIRLHGIDAPELNHPYGKAAKWALHSLCKGHRVRAEIREVDGYGRTVAQCFLPDGRDLSAEMVKQGLAIDWPKFSGGRYRALETSDARKKLFLADARQKGQMHLWERFEARQAKSRSPVNRTSRMGPEPRPRP